jgi:hypothetical protein
MTRSEMRTRVQLALNDDAEAPVFRDDTTLNQALFEAYEVLCEEAPLLKRTYTLPRREGAMLYALPGVGANIQAPYRLWLPDLQRRLSVVELRDLDARHETWMEVTGDPWHWTPIDWRTFLVWPVPTRGAGWLQVDCICWPDDVLDDADEPRDLALSAHEALVLYGEVEGYLRQGDVLRATDLWQGFIKRWGSVRSGADVERLVARLHVRSGQRTPGREAGA